MFRPKNLETLVDSVKVPDYLPGNPDDGGDTKSDLCTENEAFDPEYCEEHDNGKHYVV